MKLQISNIIFIPSAIEPSPNQECLECVDSKIVVSNHRINQAIEYCQQTSCFVNEWMNVKNKFLHKTERGCTFILILCFRMTYYQTMETRNHPDLIQPNNQHTQKKFHVQRTGTIQQSSQHTFVATWRTTHHIFSVHIVNIYGHFIHCIFWTSYLKSSSISIKK